MSGEYKWYASNDQEHFTVGPCDSREDVIEEATNEELGLHQDEDGHWSKLTFYIQESMLKPIDLSGLFDADRAIGRLEERLEEDHGIEDATRLISEQYCTADQRSDLATALKQTIASWQERNSIVVEPQFFTSTRNAETIEVSLPLPVY